MTLTADPRVRSTTRSARSAIDAQAPASPASTFATTPVRLALAAVLVRDDVYRILDGDTTVGYVQVAGPVYVALVGSVYNTSCEVAQCLDLETAMSRLECYRP
jgi:hypothetical protein